VRGFHVGEHGGRHVDEGPDGEVFEDEGVECTTKFGELRGKGGCDGLCGAVGDEGDLLVGLDAEAGENGGASARNEFRWVALRKQVRRGCSQACDDGAPSDGDALPQRVFSG
jgi:hypothetical protein